jgi:SAM-dependent methyltransferase
LKFRAPVLSAAEYDALYDNDESTSWPQTDERNDWNLIARYVSANDLTGASILDFGCYTGGLLGRLGSEYSKKGVEISAAARRVASARTGAEVYPGLDRLPAGERFDVVTAVDVVEHFPDPGRIIKSLLGVIKEGGVLMLTTGDSDSRLSRIMGARWWYCFFAEHLAFVSERWVRNWLSASDAGAQLVTATRFRHVRLPALRYVAQAISVILYFVAPRVYIRLVGVLKRMLGRDAVVLPPGAGLTKDHIFLVIRKTGK